MPHGEGRNTLVGWLSGPLREVFARSIAQPLPWTIIDAHETLREHEAALACAAGAKDALVEAQSPTKRDAPLPPGPLPADTQ